MPLAKSFFSFITFSAKSKEEILLFTISNNCFPSSVNFTPSFSLLNSFSHIPRTFTYFGHEIPENTIKSPYVILKPALECAAIGVTKVKNETKFISNPR